MIIHTLGVSITLIEVFFGIRAYMTFNATQMMQRSFLIVSYLSDSSAVQFLSESTPSFPSLFYGNKSIMN